MRSLSWLLFDDRLTHISAAVGVLDKVVFSEAIFARGDQNEGYQLLAAKTTQRLRRD